MERPPGPRFPDRLPRRLLQHPVGNSVVRNQPSLYASRGLRCIPVGHLHIRAAHNTGFHPNQDLVGLRSRVLHLLNQERTFEFARSAAFIAFWLEKRERQNCFLQKPVTAEPLAKRTPPRYPPGRSAYVGLSDPPSTGEQRYGRGLP